MSDLQKYFSSATGVSAWFVPGRIEVLGKHTDYAGGRSLLSAVDAGLTITGRRTDASSALQLGAKGEDKAENHPPRLKEKGEGPTITIFSHSVNQTLQIPVRQPAKLPAGHWGRYVQSVITRLERNFPNQLGSAYLELTSTLPLASGMSSSSALVVAVTNVLVDLFGLADRLEFQNNLKSLEDYAAYCGCIENGLGFRGLAGDSGVGTFGGSQDHTAILCAKPDSLVQYRFSPVIFEGSIPLPANQWLFVVATSGVLAEKTGKQLADYNRVSAAVREILQRWNQHTGRQDPTLFAAVHSGQEAPERLAQLCSLQAYLPGRLQQFIAESEQIIPAAATALRNQDFTTFGQLVSRSQQLAETNLGNQIPQTIALVDLAHKLGAGAASAFGAGFGGSVYALVPTHSASEFAERWLADYRQLYPHEGEYATTLITAASKGARRIKP